VEDVLINTTFFVLTEFYFKIDVNIMETVNILCLTMSKFTSRQFLKNATKMYIFTRKTSKN